MEAYTRARVEFEASWELAVVLYPKTQGKWKPRVTFQLLVSLGHNAHRSPSC